MKKYAIFGDPVEHSISPIIHNAAFKGLGIDAKYEQKDKGDFIEVVVKIPKKKWE